MGLSFDLAVEELPTQILDRAWAAHTESGRGWYNSSLAPGAWDICLEGRWRDLTPTENSWIINDLKVANNIVLACGSYVATWSPLNQDGPAGLYDFTTIDPSFTDNPFRDGFLATCQYDLIEDPLAWKIFPTRSMLEIIGFGHPGPQSEVEDAGLQSLCVDFRTNAISAAFPTISPQSLIVTTVGHIPCQGINTSLFGPTDYTPFTKSVYTEQDYLPMIYTFEIQGSTNNPTVTLNTPAWPYDEGDPTSSIPGLSLYFDANGDINGPDRLGHSYHLLGTNQDYVVDQNRFSSCMGFAPFMQAGVRIVPLEQITFRAHQIGIELQAPGTSTYSYSNTDPYRLQRFLPTPGLGTFNVMKPIEFFFCTPDYNFTHYTPTLSDATPANNEFAPHGEYRRGTAGDSNQVMSDWAIWRQGFIPRRLWNVQSVYNSSYRSQNSLWYRTYEGADSTSIISYLVFTGDCLQDDPTNRNGGSAYATNPLEPIYSPLIAVANLGVLQDNPQGSQYRACNGYAWTYTRRNLYLEDAGALTNTSLDNSTVVATLPVVRAQYPASDNQLYSLVFLLNSTDPESRGEILMAQPWMFNLEFTGYAKDWRPIVPLGFWGADFETQTAIELPDYWTRTVGQPFGITSEQVSQVQGLFDSYLAPADYVSGESTGTSVGGLGYISRTRTGPYMLFFDAGTTQATLDYTINNFGQVKPEAYGVTYKVGSLTTTNSPDEQNAQYDGSVDTNPSVSQQTTHIINTTTTKYDGAFAGSFQWNGLPFEINTIDLTAIYPAATAPAPTYTYTTLDSLVSDLNAALAYVISAGPPYNQNTPVGLKGVQFYKTSDGLGIYGRTDNTIISSNGDNDPTQWGTLVVGDPAFCGDNDNYPYNSQTNILSYAPLVGPTWNGSSLGGAAAVVSDPTVQDIIVAVSETGDLFNNAILSGAETGRIALSGSYDIDRAQWLFTFGSTTGFSAVAAVADFTEILDQTDNFYSGTPSYAYVESAIFANRQGSNSFDGVLWAGPLDTDSSFGNRFTTNVVANSASREWVVRGTTGRSVKVFLNYMLYDGLDSIIAREVMNLGLRVTPENVEWYKRKIMGQEASTITLEELEAWMASQRQQYQDLIKSRDKHNRLAKRREEAGTLSPSVTEDLQNRLDGDFYALDEQSLETLLPELRQLPPNPDSEPSDADQLGNTLSGDIEKQDEKRRETDN